MLVRAITFGRYFQLEKPADENLAHYLPQLFKGTQVMKGLTTIIGPEKSSGEVAKNLVQRKLAFHWSPKPYDLHQVTYLDQYSQLQSPAADAVSLTEEGK